MELLHFQNIIFAQLPGEKSTDPGEFNFFYISPLKSLDLVLILGEKLDDHRGTWMGCITYSFTYCFQSPKKHHFRHKLNIQEFLNPLCTCSLEAKNTSQCLLHSHPNTPFRIDLRNSVKTFVVGFESLSDSKKVEIVYLWRCSVR